MAKKLTKPADTRNPLPALTAAEYEDLKEDIRVNGQAYDIIVSAGPAMAGAIVDGFNRDRALRELKITPKVRTEKFATEADFRIRQIDLNMKRRQLTPVQRVRLGMAREPWERQLAEARMRSGKASPKSGPGSAGKASAVVAKAVGLGTTSYDKGKFVLENAPSTVRKDFESGAISIDRAYKLTKRARGMDARSVLQKRVDQRIGDDLPAGKFGAIVLCPQWRTQAMKHEKGRFLPNEIATIDVRSIATRDGIVMLWAPTIWLREAYDVIERWDARPFAVVTWILDEATQGEVVRDRTLFGILASFGKFPAPTRKTNTIMSGSGLGVPGEAFALLDELVPSSAGIVLFGSTSRGGWTSWNPKVD